MEKHESKKLQSSIEFLIIMSAVVGMAVFGISYYYSVHSLFSNAISSANQPIFKGTNTTESSNDVISAYIFVPRLNVGEASQATLLVSTSLQSNISIRAMGKGIEISPSNITNSTNAFGSSYAFYINKPNAGYSNISFYITAKNGSIISHENATSEIFAYTPLTSNKSSTSNATISYVYIKPNKELIAYPIKNPKNLYYITESSHCSDLNFMGQQMPISAQCGNASWYFWYFSSDCYYGSAQVPTMTYCVYKHYSGHNASQIGNGEHYIYNISLGMGYEGLNLTSEITSNNTHSILYYGKEPYGNASTGNSIYAQSPISEEYIIRSGSGNYTEAYANYTSFEYAYSSLKNDLEYYNNSGNGNLGTINKEIYSYNNLLSTMLNSSNNASSGYCFTSKSGNAISYLCNPGSQFEFNNISVKIKNYPYVPYKTDYEGSYITVH